MILPADRFQIECSVFRAEGCIWSEDGDSGFKGGKGTKATSVPFDNVILQSHPETLFTSEGIHPLVCSPLELNDSFPLGRSQGIALEAAACDQHG